MQINRNKYLSQLIEQQNSPLIKIITGLRRSGKSYLMYTLFRDYLRAQGIPADHIIEVDLDDFGNNLLRDAQTCYSFVKDQVRDDHQYFLLIDEVQRLGDEFADVLSGLNHIKNLNIYATGSNSHLLSSDVATEFRGRAEIIHLRPLSFVEFSTVHEQDFTAAWGEYYTYGGLPLVVLSESQSSKINVLEGLLQTNYLRDITERYALHKKARLHELLRVLASSIGSQTSASKLTNTFISRGREKISRNTVIRYLDILQESFLIDAVPVWDIRGRRHIDAPAKYYFTDSGLRNALLGFGSLGQMEPSHLMENVIYNELCIRGYQVKVGNINGNVDGKRVSWEVDFVAEKDGEVTYIQSAWSLPDAAKHEQELRPLRAIGDSHRKLVVTADPIQTWTDLDGITIMSLRDFLLPQE